MDVIRTPATGWIEVIVGSMFSGKSEELIRRLRRAQIARQRVQIFKPAVDTRYADDHIVSHSELRIPSEQAASAADLLAKVRPDTEVVGIDEGQFFDAELPAVATALAARGVRVIVAGLDQDYLGKPFEPMPQLLAIAEYITKTRAICMVCGNPANHTQRLVGNRSAGAARRAGHLRGALPSLLRSHPGGGRGAAPEGAGRRGSRSRAAMTVEQLARALELSLLALGLLFLVVNLRVGRELWQWWRRRAGALLVWLPPKPPYYAINLAIGVMLGLLLFVTVFLVPTARRVGLRRADDVPVLRLPAAAVDAHHPGPVCRWGVDRLRLHDLRRDRRAVLEGRGGGHAGPCLAAAGDCTDPERSRHAPRGVPARCCGRRSASMRSSPKGAPGCTWARGTPGKACRLEGAHGQPPWR